MRRSNREITPGTLAFVGRVVRPLDPDRIHKHTMVLVLGLAWKPPEPTVSSVSYVVLLGSPHDRIDILPHCDLAV